MRDEYSRWLPMGPAHKALAVSEQDGNLDSPLEFARQVGGQAEHLAKPVRALADMYSIVAYSSGHLTSSAEQHLRSFWEAVAVMPATASL